MQKTPVQYILVRNDLATMTPGRAAAQAAHAANQSVMWGKAVRPGWVQEWEKETRAGFGTTIVLEASLDEIQELHEKLQSLITDLVLESGITHDPTYAVPDGECVHFVPVDTCGWVIGYKEDLVDYLGAFPLYWSDEGVSKGYMIEKELGL